jgi:hypothetical protein
VRTSGKIANTIFGIACFLMLGFGLSSSAHATSITVELASGSAWAIDTRRLADSAGGRAEEYIPFSGFGYILRKLDPQAQWDWNALTGLLVINLSRQRFSLSAKDGVMAVGNRLRKVPRPIRSQDQDIWIPIESFYLIVQSTSGMRIRERPVLPPIGPEITPGSTPRGDDMLDESLLPLDESIDAVPGGAVAPLATIAPGQQGAWRVVLAPLWNESSLKGAGDASLIRPSLNQIADRVSALLAASQSFAPVVLSEQGQVTTGVRVLNTIEQQGAEMAVFLKVESSPLVSVPLYTVYYVDESVDSRASNIPSVVTGPGAIRASSYMPFQVGNRRLAEILAAELAKIEGFRYQAPIPAPLYLLKRCPARSAMVVLTYPERSPDLRRVSDRSFRESLARQLSDALRSYQRERLETGGERAAAPPAPTARRPGP